MLIYIWLNINHMSTGEEGPSLISEDEIKNEITRVMKALYERGMGSALGGHVILRSPRAQDI